MNEGFRAASLLEHPWRPWSAGDFEAACNSREIKVPVTSEEIRSCILGGSLHYVKGRKGRGRALLRSVPEFIWRPAT
eukprot:5027028-Alexandrium_andersonii.AAC.1